MLIPVERNPNLFRDEKTGAIINCDKSSYEQHLLMKQKRDLQKVEIEDLKNEISEIKSLLKELLNQDGPIKN